MNSVGRFLVWCFKTFLMVSLVNLMIVFPLALIKDSELMKSFGIFIAIIAWLLTIWISWQMEFRNGRYRFGKWLGSKFRNVTGIKVSKNLRDFTDKMLIGRTFNESEIIQFKVLLEKENLTDVKKDKFLLQELNKLFEIFSEDRKIDDKEWELFFKSRNAFSCAIPEDSKSGINKKLLGDYRIRGIIAEGRLLEMPEANFPLKKNENEKVFIVTPAFFIKRKRVTERINYSGITGSVRLGMGFRYRIGTIKPRVLQKEVVSIEDKGVVFITSERVGFHGDRKSWTSPINKVSDVQVEDDVGLEIFKSGRENPILIYPNDLDTVAAVLNTIMNGEYQIDQNKVAI